MPTQRTNFPLQPKKQFVFERHVGTSPSSSGRRLESVLCVSAVQVAVTPAGSSLISTEPPTFGRQIPPTAYPRILWMFCCLSSFRDNQEWLLNVIQQSAVGLQKKTNFVTLSPPANYTAWATANCRWNLVPTFVDRGMSRGQRGESPTVVNLSFLDRSRYFLSSSSSFIRTRTEWTSFQTHCYSENLVALGIEPGTSGTVARKSKL
jgi:hypothetical protein